MYAIREVWVGRHKTFWYSPNIQNWQSVNNNNKKLFWQTKCNPEGLKYLNNLLFSQPMKDHAKSF